MLPTRVPVLLPGSSETSPGERSDVRPSSQWVEPARSGAGLAVTELPLLTPYFYYGTTQAVGALTSLWIRREGGPVTDVVTAAINVNFVYIGSVAIASGDTEATALFGTALLPGDDVRVFMFGGNQTVASGMLRTPSRLFRLLPAALGKVWVMQDGEWVAPPAPYVNDDGSWALAAEVHVRDGGAWTRLI